MKMLLGHTIALDPTQTQEDYFRRACGVSRLIWNWSLVEWKRMYDAGEKPSANKIKAKWNAIRRTEYPFTLEVTKCRCQSVIDLGVAFNNFFRDLKKPKGQRRARYPRFKKKGLHNSFALWNDQFAVKGDRIRIPRLGWVKMREPLRFEGKIIGARISLIGGRWHVSIQAETDQDCAHGIGAVGIDLGITTLATLSRPLLDGRTKIDNPSPRKRLMKRQRKMSRRISRQELQRRKANAKASRRQRIRQARLRCLHYRISCIRKDAMHKATTAICDTFATIVLEDLNVSGMTKNKRLAGSIADASFGEFRRQIEYKMAMRGGHVVISDRWFPSSKTCHVCSHVLDSLPLHRREWTCPDCGTIHDRDENAAKNLELVGQTLAEPAGNDARSTRGELEALAMPHGVVKLPTVNRELEPKLASAGCARK